MCKQCATDAAQARGDVTPAAPDRPTREQVEDALTAADLDAGGAAVRAVLAAEVRALRDDLGMEMGMRAAAVDELEALRRRLWELLGADQFADDEVLHLVHALCRDRDELLAALAARTPQPAEPTRHLVILSGLADEIDQHAAIAARPGQMGDLERIACAVRDVANELAPLPTVSDGEDETSRAVSRLMFDARPVDHAAEQVAVRTVDLARVLNEFIQYAAAGINKPRQEGP